MKLKIGTRKSALAMAQTQLILKKIQSEFSDYNFEIVPIITKGDKILDKPLTQIGGKGIFITEIERALQTGEIDIAVHSAKDLPYKLEDNMEISAVASRRETSGYPEDTFVTPTEKEYKNSDRIIIGTGSQRRILQMKKIFPNAEFKEIRGNVGTRIDKMHNGEYDALVLAYAGLTRLGLAENSNICVKKLDKGQVIPAPCQGIIAIECKKGSPAAEIVGQINDEKTMSEFSVMRSLSEKFGADCTVPLGAYAEIIDEYMFLSATVGKEIFFEKSGLSDTNKLVNNAVIFLGSD